jgi:hypothetical protein
MYEIEDFAYFGSTLGNAIHSGLTVEQIWSCLVLSQTREQFDEAVSATIRLSEIAHQSSI